MGYKKAFTISYNPVSNKIAVKLGGKILGKKKS
jgi:hypothetical protein